MRYRNRRTGYELETACLIAGDEWEAAETPPSAKDAGEEILRCAQNDTAQDLAAVVSGHYGELRRDGASEKKTAAKKSTAKKPAAKKSTAKKTSTKKSTAKKPAAKKTAAKKTGDGGEQCSPLRRDGEAAE